MKIYGISGLGADERVFDFLDLPCEFIYLPWLDPLEDESLAAYAKRLAEGIDQESEFGLLGLSFGGLVAVEISKLVHPKITVLISSAETSADLPRFFRTFKWLARILPVRFFKPPKRFVRYLFGTENRTLLNRILEDTDPNFAKWAVNELLNWKHVERLNSTIKIHGTKDKVLPPRPDSRTILIPNGEHFMIVDRCREVSDAMHEVLGTTEAGSYNTGRSYS